MSVTKERNKLREILEYYCGFHGDDVTLTELNEELENLYGNHLIKNNGNMMEAMMADQEAIMAAEKLAIDFLKLKKKVGEWHDIMKNCLGNGDIEGWGRCLGILMEIRDYGEKEK